MPSSTEQNSGLLYGWNNAESGWGGGMNQNVLLLGRSHQLAVIDRDLTIPPGSPTDGDRYIVDAFATGAWAGQDNNIAIWDGQLTVPAWAFVPPKEGWLCYIQDEGILSVFKTATGWSAGLAI